MEECFVFSFFVDYYNSGFFPTVWHYPIVYYVITNTHQWGNLQIHFMKFQGISILLFFKLVKISCEKTGYFINFLCWEKIWDVIVSNFTKELLDEYNVIRRKGVHYLTKTGLYLIQIIFQKVNMPGHNFFFNLPR